MKTRILVLLFCLSFFNSNAQFLKFRDYLVTLNTSKGTMHVILYRETKLHKANFVNLIKQNFYDSLMFHRAISNFMIQGGDPFSKDPQKINQLGSGGVDMPRIPYEYSAKRIHKKGAIAAARDNNPNKESSGCQFYIVQGRKFTREDLSKVEISNKVKYTEKHKVDYENLGGTPFLDNNYTVFGEIIDNLEVIDAINAVDKGQGDSPLEPIRMSMKIEKMGKRKISKIYGYSYRK